MKASLSSQARTGDGGPIKEFSSAQRLGERRPVFPSLKQSQKVGRVVVMSHTEKLGP
jgi:hypothetical protein